MAMRPAKPLPQPRVDYLNPNPAYMKKSASSKYGKHAVVQYGRVEDGIDFEYEVKNNGLKENIIVRACREDYTFCYRMKLRGLSPVLSEDGHAVDFYADEAAERKRVFHIPGAVYDGRRRNTQ